MSDYIPTGYSLTPYLSETRQTTFSAAGQAIEAGKKPFDVRFGTRGEKK